jgi:hypothetical protein
MSAAAPTLRQGAVVALAGYLLSFGTPFASFHALPALLDAGSAEQTGRNVAAHPGLLSAAIVAMLLNFVGDILSAWGMYVLLRPVNARVSLLAAWFRLVYTAVGFAAVLHLVTARELASDPRSLFALGQEGLDAQVYVALRAFQSQFDFSLILFGMYLLLLGAMWMRARHLPRWLGVVLAVDGAGWIATEAGPYVLPGVNLGWLFFTSFGELVLLGWLIGWGTRLKEPAQAPA